LKILDAQVVLSRFTSAALALRYVLVDVNKSRKDIACGFMLR